MGDNPGGAVYGTILVGTLLAAESARRETYFKTVGAVAIGLLLYWLAHSYAQLTGQRLRGNESLTLEGFARAMAHEVSILFGALIPLLVLVLSWAAGARLTTAVTAGVWTSAAMILLVELTVAVRARQSRRELIVQTAVGALLGLLVLALRVLLH